VGQGILPLYFNPSVEVSLGVLKAIYAAGMRAAEYTNRGEEALQNFRSMVKQRNASMPGLLMGVGTIKNIAQAKAYLEAGADFLVSPGFVPEVAVHCVAKDIFYAPGCMTPSEIIAAENAGIKFIKLFPGNLLGTEFLTTIRAVFPELLFMPTGGVDATKESIESWFRAGVCAVGMGSKLISKRLMDARDYAAIEANTREVLDVIASVRR
jgi:2-dehydro-3-deoxyphosphogluconate aldolase / (4S)-4-hydroxy-2-oxoglutarate aldolase